MALDLQNKYPGRFDPKSADYPQGKFKNRSSPTAQDGSYMERDWLNDWNGFFGALLSRAGMTPNGNVDTAQSSQLYDALKNVIREGNFGNATTISASSTSLTAAQIGQAFLFTTALSTVTLPTATGIGPGGTYKLQTSTGFTLSVTGGGAMQVGNQLVTSTNVPAGTEVLAVSNGTIWWVFGTGSLSKSASFTSSLTSNGYRYHPNGSVDQWGLTPSIGGASSLTVAFPVPFPNACYSVAIVRETVGSSTQAESAVTRITQSNLTIFNASSNATIFRFMAVGS